MTFKIQTRDRKTAARTGLLSTPHGLVKTPAYVFVGTYGQIRHLSPRDIRSTKTQIIIANTFHLWKEVDKQKINKRVSDSFLTRKLGLKIPTMTDSGGFQVLSLAFGLDNKVGKFIVDDAKKTKAYRRQNVRITAHGVHFNFMGQKSFLGPKRSIDLQTNIGADIIFAFDHITGPLDSRTYNLKALTHTGRWAKDCLVQFKSRQNNISNRQMLYGIIQGGIFKDLRIKSAKQIGSLSFDGFGIGGSYTQKQIAQILDWIIPYLPEEKPRHLLGVGKVIDVFEAVEKGVDTFDCVIPTREARHGRLYTKTGPFDIRNGKSSKSEKPLEIGCRCPACKRNLNRKKLSALFRSPRKQDQIKAQRYALLHNMWFFNNLLENIRSSINNDRFSQFKKSFLKNYLKQKSNTEY